MRFVPIYDRAIYRRYNAKRLRRFVPITKAICPYLIMRGLSSLLTAQPEKDLSLFTAIDRLLGGKEG